MGEEREKGTALASVITGGPLALDTAAADFFSTLPASEKARTVTLLQGKVTPLADMIGKTIEIVDVIAQRIELIDRETGEVEPAVRTVLVTKDGAAYQAVSSGVVKSLRLLAQFYGPPRWVDGLKVEVQSITTASKFRVFVLNPAA